MYVTLHANTLIEHSSPTTEHSIIYVTGFAKTQHNTARTEIHFIA